MAKKNIGAKVETSKITVSKHKEKIKKKDKRIKKSKGINKKVFIALISILILLALAAVITQNWDKITAKKEKAAASINGEVLTVNELDNYYSRLNPQTQAYITKTMLLDELINKRVMVTEAEKKGIFVNQSEIDDYIKGFLSQIQISKEDLEARLIAQNLSWEILTLDIKQQLLITKLYQSEIIEKVNVSDKELEDYYDENIDLFKTAEQVRAEHILICHKESLRCESNMTKEEALAKINQIKSMVTSTNFEELAKKYSKDPSSENGGDLGYFEKGTMVKPFEDAAFSLSIGGVSDVVETQYGFHILKILDIKQSSVQKLDEVKEDLMQQLLLEKQQEEFKTYLEGLKSKANIKIFFNESVEKAD